MDFVKRKQQAAKDAEPFKKQAKAKEQEANRWREQLKELKKADRPSKAKLAEAEQRFSELTKEAREQAARAEAIENAVYDLKAINPNRAPDEDTRTPAELLDVIEQKGREVAEALSVLRSLP